MRRVVPFMAAIFAVLVPLRAAHAGAWTLPRHGWRLFSNLTVSRARKQYDASGQANTPVYFDKILTQACFEYGATDWLTAFAIPEYTRARYGLVHTAPTTDSDSAVTVGGRVRLLQSFGIFSLQASVKTAGAFNMNVSAHGQSGRQLELRILYGADLALLHRDAFFDLEVGQRWLAGARPDEVPVDVTLGVHLTRHIMVMAQSFNTIAEDNARPPYTYYRMHKVAFSVVTDVSRHFSLQVGGFLSPFGQNALAEKGVMVSLWTTD